MKKLFHFLFIMILLATSREAAAQLPSERPLSSLISKKYLTQGTTVSPQNGRPASEQPLPAVVIKAKEKAQANPLPAGPKELPSNSKETVGQVVSRMNTRKAVKTRS